MMADPVRMAAYEQALRATCRPGCVLLDLGTGTGIFALLASRLGARKVYAIDSSEAINVARETAQVNGVADRITFLQGDATRIALPELVDVIVADLRGALPMTGTSLATMIDARRFLAPAGVVIPDHDTIRGALVEDERLYDSLVSPWRRCTFGFDTTCAERFVLHTWQKAHVGRDSLLTQPADLAHLTYASIDDPNVCGSMADVIVRPGTAHGLCVWFDTRLVGMIGFSNEPGRPPTVYRHGFFPFPTPVRVEAGDAVAVNFRASLVHDEYVWSWETIISSASGCRKAHSAQSTFHAAPLSAERVRTVAADSTPSLGVNGAIDRAILLGLDGRTTLAALAESLCEQFPDYFPNRSSALARVTASARRYLELDCL
jgi:type I protein arginine methyltransferase